MVKMNFEESLKRLEEIAQKMESGDLSLDESLKIFEEGIKLSRFCESKLSNAEQKLEILKSIDIDELENEDVDDKKIKKKENKKNKEEIIDENDNEDMESFLF